ncbi:mannosylglycerate hydrolase [Bacillus sp. FJAT-50079]|uniref:mannosylglycerate hydrolase n=1 Tax=Bacillus sp. FJAT-50079 TaxID=2833577 RepID=UPI001BC9CF1B|nr:mannosylglycerate hydrolase [Bacillus sp. FJAT-50079]MBS4208521.1 mannosylglycerate hydrolase [Bacillus sp. FJAT-50079]
MTNVHIVPHMHWDREWYFTTEESRILLVNNMEEIMDMLENNPDYPYYVLDGQTSILEDYFAVKPENKERVKKLVQEGRLIIGPWYTQTDEMVVGGESIVRNLLYGIKDSEQFGEYMRIGYLPDSFGQSAQMPMILNGFDITYSIFWRGTSERHGTDKTEFYWETDDGSKVLVQLFPLGYAIGKYLPEDEEELQERIDKYFAVLDRGATTDHIIIPNGHDQMPIQKNIFTIMEKLRKLYPDREFFLSKYENIFEELEKQDDLAILQGEFLDGKYMRVHRSIYSTRMDIKAANTRIENKITNILEPLASMAYKLGFEYHHGLIELIWKEIMKNHAHDSIGCCCSDKVHREICNRFFLAEEKVDQLINFYKRKIVDSMDTEKQHDRLTLFNFLPYERTEVVTATVMTKLQSFTLVDQHEKELDFEIVSSEITDPGLIDRQIVHYGNYDPFIKYTIQLKDTLPAMGYKTYFVVEHEHLKGDSYANVEKIETDYYDITVNPNGTLNIFDKKINESFENVLLLENGGDDGDEYDYSPLANEKLIYSDQVNAVTEVKQNRYGATIDITYSLLVPSNLEKRKAQVFDRSIDIHMVIHVPHHKPVINVNVEVSNRAKDHRLRMLIPTNIASAFSIADNQFGAIKRDVIDAAIEVWEKEDWDERPDSIYPMLSYVGLANEHYGVSVLTNSTREYEIVGEQFDTIAVTLFRSIGVLGKENLQRRPGRPSGIKLPTPDSQMLGKISIDFAITSYFAHENVARMAKEYLTPVETYNKIPYNAMKLNVADVKTPLEYSFLQEVQPNVVLSTLKKAEKENQFVLRFFNPMDEEKTAVFRFNDEIGQAKMANLNEEALQSLQVNDRQIEVKVVTNQVKTIMF